ncbi:MAG TPA: hypothetical protein VF846_18145, partial [Thermoanaerobaculia bacterium]
VAPGGLITYNVQVRNNYVTRPDWPEATAPGVHVRVPLPTGVQFVSLTGPGTVNAGTVDWNLGAVASGAVFNFSLTVQLAFDADPTKEVVLGPFSVTTAGPTGPVVQVLPDTKTTVGGTRAAPPELSVIKFVPDGITIQQVLATSQLPGADPTLASSLKKLYPILNNPTAIEEIGRTINPNISDTTDAEGFFMQAVIAPGMPNGPAKTKITYALIYGNSSSTSALGAYIQERIPEGTAYVPNSVTVDGGKPSGTFRIEPNGRDLKITVGTVAKGYHLIMYTVELLPTSRGGIAPGQRIQARGTYIGSSSLLHTSYAYPEQVDVQVVAPGNGYTLVHKLTPNANVGDLVTYDIFYQNTGGVATNDFRIRNPIPANQSFVNAAYLDESRQVRGIDPGRGEANIQQPAAGSTSGEVVYHLGRVQPRESGWVRLVLRLEESARSTDGLQYDNEAIIDEASFPGAARAAAAGAPGNPSLTNIGGLGGGLGYSKSIGRLLDGPRLIVSVSAPLVVQEGNNYDYIIAVANPTDAAITSTAIEMLLPPEVTWVGAEGQDNAFEAPASDSFIPTRSIIFPDRNSTGTLFELAPHSTLMRKVTVRAPNLTGADRSNGKTLRSGGAHTFNALGFLVGATDVKKIAFAYSGRVGTFVYANDKLFSDYRSQVVQSCLSVVKYNGPALTSDPNYERRIAELTGSASFVAIGGADTVPTNSGELIVPIGGGKPASNGQPAVPGNVLAFGQVGKLITNDGGSIVASGAGNIVASGAGNLLQIPKLITNDGGSLITNDGGSIRAILASLVAQGAGNIVASGAGNIVASGGGNLITNDGGSLISNDGGGLVRLDVSKLIGNDGGGIVASGAGNFISGLVNPTNVSGLIASNRADLVSLRGGSIFIGGGASLVASGAGNRVQDESGNAVDADALQYVSTDDSMVARFSADSLVVHTGGNLKPPIVYQSTSAAAGVPATRTRPPARPSPVQSNNTVAPRRSNQSAREYDR